jgi:type IV secretory pathway VirB2 component (pilin)
MSLIQFAQNLSQFIVGPFGTSMLIFGIALTAILAAIHAMAWRHLWEVIFVGAFVFSSGWIVTTFLGG